MTYTTLRVGSQSDDVKKLQTALNSAGYNIAADGIYGNQTANAVKQYQQANGLTVDGIAGSQTLSKLYGGSQAAQQTAQQPQQAVSSVPSKYDPNANAAYQQAMAQLETIKKQQPTYQDNYSDQINALFQQITNRQPFQYDAASDPLYQQYRAQYSQLGERAMQDTMGQAAALTGGYGSSYGQAVGQQQYDQYMQRAADIIPELSDRAFQQYQARGNQMQQQYAMLGDLRDTEYGRFQDSQNLWLNQLNMAQNDADTAYSRGYNEWNSQYQVYQDQLARQDSQRTYLMSLISSTGYNPSDAELAAAGISRAQADSARSAWVSAQATSTGGGGGGSSSKNSGSPNKGGNAPLTYYQVKTTIIGMSQAGESSSAIAKELSDRVADGSITQAEANYLKKHAGEPSSMSY